MTPNSEPIKMKQMRLMILSSLNRMYPTQVLIQTLHRVMCGFDEHYDLSLLLKDVTYLKQKGYIMYVDDRLGGADKFEDKCIGLTAEGKDIADRTQTDNALEI